MGLLSARTDSGVEDVDSGVQARFSSSCIAFDVVSALLALSPDCFDFPLFMPAPECPLIDPKDFGCFPWGDVFDNSGILNSWEHCTTIPGYVRLIKD